MPHWIALRHGKNGSRELSCGSTSSICQNILKSDNLLHKGGFVKTQSLRTASRNLQNFRTASSDQYQENKMLLES